MNYNARIVRIFNIYYSSFLKEIKKVDDTLRQVVKENYKIIDKSDDQYLNWFNDSLSDCFGDVKTGNIETSKDRMVCKDIKLGDLLTKAGDDNKNIILNYTYILFLFSYIATIDNSQDELVDKVITLLQKIQTKEEFDWEDETSEIIDDDIKDILTLIKNIDDSKLNVKLDDEKYENSAEGMADFYSKIGDSKIANLAKEISSDIDLSTLQTENPEDLMKNLLGGGNVLGNIVQKVSSSLNEKISKGELKHEELLGEAMSMMSMLNGKDNPFNSNPFMSQMMKNMKSGKTNVRQDILKKDETRDRLRKKLEARQNKT